jgi:hypothetical protein
MAFDDITNKLDAVFVQRTGENEYYEQINISGSNSIVYLNENGVIDVDRISDWATKYGIGSGGSSDTASYVPFNGDRAITRNDPDFLGLNVGGESTVEFLNNFFFPFLASTMTLSSIGTTLRETGSGHTVPLSGTITGNSETIFESTGSVFKGGVLYAPFNSGSTYSITPNDIVTGSSGTSSYSYQSRIWVDNNGSPGFIYSNTRTVSYIFPYLYGTSPIEGLSGTTLYNELTKSVSNQGDKTGIVMGGLGVYIYFCYPDSYPDLTSIKNPSLLEFISAFEYSGSVPVTSSGAGLAVDWMRNYKVYRTILQSDPDTSSQGYSFYY